MSEDTGTLGVIGCGTMGEAIVRGILRSQTLKPQQVWASDPRPDQLAALQERHGIHTTLDNLEAARAGDVILVATKPQQLAYALDQDAARTALTGKLVISIAAGVRLEQLQAWLPGSAIIRAMPNTPALIGEGMTALARGRSVTDAQASLAKRLFQGCGRSLEVDEKNMDAITALNGSGPAFAYLIVEALADGGVMMGLRRDVALTVAAQMLQGSARMVLETGLHPAVLKDQVTTPAGCTIAGLLTLEDGGARGLLARAVEHAARVAGGLGQNR